MASAEARSRKGRKAGVAADRLANAARLAALEKNLGVPIKRHRDPGNVQGSYGQDGKIPEKDKDTSVVVMKGF